MKKRDIASQPSSVMSEPLRRYRDTLQVGDMVCAHDPETGEKVFKTFVKTFVDTKVGYARPFTQVLLGSIWPLSARSMTSSTTVKSWRSALHDSIEDSMKRIYADFNDFASDGSLPLTCLGSVDSIAVLSEPLEEGEEVLLSDGELKAVARVFRCQAGGWEARGVLDILPTSSSGKDE